MNVIGQASGNTTNNIIEQKYIARVLTDEASNMYTAQNRILAKFKPNSTDIILSKRSFQVQGTTGVFTHAMVQRFVDMKYIRGRSKLAIPVHNKILYGHFNNIIYRLSFGLTDDIKAMIAKEYNIEM